MVMGSNCCAAKHLAPNSWIREVLKSYNDVRKKYGAPPLQWSDECYTEALKQANECMREQRLLFGNSESPAGIMGQLMFLNEDELTKGIPKASVNHFCEEADNYDFDNPGFADNIGGFTQTVWVNTEYVGMAVSDDNMYVVSNFLPTGNLDDPEHFRRNVHLPGTSMQKRDPPPLIGEVLGKKWNKDFELALSRCPIISVKDSIIEDMEQGKTVILRRHERSIELTIYGADGIKETTKEGSW